MSEPVRDPRFDEMLRWVRVEQLSDEEQRRMAAILGQRRAFRFTPDEWDAMERPEPGEPWRFDGVEGRVISVLANIGRGYVEVELEAKDQPAP